MPTSTYFDGSESVQPTQPPIMDQGNEFQGYDINGYENASRDHLSTFALDVDTASYSVARKYIQEGSLPPAEAIRVEEFLNSFDQGYASPENKGFALYADGAPSPFTSDGTYLIRFGVQGYQVPDYARKPANLTFVIDVSGSMDMDNRLGLVKQSLELLVRRLTQQDSVAIIVYGSDAHMVLEPTSAYFKDTILNAIQSLQIEGSTNAEAGLRLGYKTAMRSYRQDATNRVILCSDGVANTGATSSDEILNYVHGYVEEGVTLTTMGFGMGNFNDALLEQLADKGNGNYNYIDTLDEARKLFVENLTSTLQVIGKDAKVQVDFNPDVVSYYRLVGYENRAVADEDFRDNSVDAGEVGAGHSVVAMYAVHFKPGAEGRVATLQLRWEDPDTYEVQETDGILNTWDIARSYADASPRYRLAVTVMQFAEVLRQSPWGEETGLDVISEYASGLRSEIHDQEVTEFADLVWQAARIERRSW
jgi:Ca-activated chloride channel family protein